MDKKRFGIIIRNAIDYLEEITGYDRENIAEEILGMREDEIKEMEREVKE